MDYQLPSQLDYKQVPTQLRMIVELLKHNRVVDIDLTNICRVDSSGIVLLIELKNLAKQHSWQVNYLSPTSELLKLCSLYSLNIF